MKKTTCIPVLVVLLTLLPLVSAAHAQITSATIVGTVTDSSGAALPGATVTARNVDTGFTRTVPSNEDGAYRLEFLPIGSYVVEVTLAGFKTSTRSGIVLNVNDTTRVDASLSVGGVAEAVTVEAEAPAVNTSTSDISRTIDAAAIQSLPLVDRNVYTLLDLTPGVQSNNNGVASASSGTNSLILGFPEQRTLINGGADGGTGSVNYYLDGGINMTGLRNTGNILPNPDAIQEFKVQTNSYPVEYGRFSSGIINVVTKSGTNMYKGSAFEYVRDGKMNAKEWGSVLATPPLKRNQFGGTLGGPLIHDRTFFFTTYSGLRQTTNNFFNTAIVPTAQERTGDFSASRTLPNDPATPGQPFVCNGVVGVICPNRLDPVAMKIINDYIPLSNVSGNIWQGFVPSPYDSDEMLIKVDHQMNAAHRFSGNYFLTEGSNTVKAGSGNLPWASQQFKWRQHNVNLSDTWVISTNKINQTWFSFNRNFGGRLQVPAVSLTDLGSKAIIQGAPSLPQITVSGFFTLTNAIGGPKAGGDFYSARDVFSWTRGAHALKVGGELSYNKTVQDTLLNNYGVLTFNNSVTRNALADFLIGIPSAMTQDAPITALWNSWYGAAFLQDDYRINGRMTLNLGLRWDVQTPGTDPLNRFSTYVPGQQSIARPSTPTGQLFYGDPGIERGVIKTAWNHLSPRAGFVWDPFGDGKTSIRAAGGIFYGSISGNEWNTMTNFQPWSTRLTFTNINLTTNAAGVPNGASLSNPYNNYVGGPPFPYNGSYTNGGGILGVSQDFEWARAYQTNVGVQRQIGKSLALGAAYVGTFTRNLPFQRDVNYPVATPTASTAGANILSRRPNPVFGTVLILDSDQVLELQRPADHIHAAAVAPHQLQRLLYAQQDHGQRAAAQQHHGGRGAELQQVGLGLRPGRYRPAPRLQHERELDARLLPGRWRAEAHPERVDAGADHQAAQRPAVHDHQRQRRREPRRQYQRPRAVDRGGSAHRQSDAGTLVQSRRVRPEPGRDRCAGRRQLAAQPSRWPRIPRRRSGSLARLPFARQDQADLPRRGDQRLQHRELRAARQRRALGRDVHDLRRDPHRRRDAPPAAGGAPGFNACYLFVANGGERVDSGCATCGKDAGREATPIITSTAMSVCRILAVSPNSNRR